MINAVLNFLGFLVCLVFILMLWALVFLALRTLYFRFFSKEKSDFDKL